MLFKLFVAILVHAQHLHTGVFVQLELILDMFPSLIEPLDGSLNSHFLACLISYLLDFIHVILEVQLVYVFQAKAFIIVFDVYVS